MGDDEDRTKLNAMTELEREMILAERADARDAARERHRAEKALKQAQEQQQRATEKVVLQLKYERNLRTWYMDHCDVCT